MQDYAAILAVKQEGWAMRAANGRSTARRLPSPAVGLDMIELLNQIVRSHREIEVVHFGRPKLRPPPHARSGLTQSDSRFMQNAKTRWCEPVPYWDAIMLSMMSSSDIPEEVLRLAAFSHPISETQFSVNARELSPKKIKALIEEHPETGPLAICSEVKLTGGETKHIPMMDFRCPQSDHCLSLVCKVAELFEVGRGYVLETDRSYHFYGAELLTASGQTTFLARALRFSPIVDRTWIAHQLTDMCCNLRIAPVLANGEIRRIVAIVG